MLGIGFSLGGGSTVSSLLSPEPVVEQSTGISFTNAMNSFGSDTTYLMDCQQAAPWYIEGDVILNDEDNSAESVVFAIGDPGSDDSEWVDVIISFSVDGALKIGSNGFTPGEDSLIVDTGELTKIRLAWNPSEGTLQLFVNDALRYQVTPTDIDIIDGFKALYLGIVYRGNDGYNDSSDVTFARFSAQDANSFREYTLSEDTLVGDTIPASTGNGLLDLNNYTVTPLP